METFMVTFMVERKSRNLCLRVNHLFRALDNRGTDKGPAQGVHGSDHEPFMVRLQQFEVGSSPSVALDHENTITPAQGVHGSNHEGLMVDTGLIGLIGVAGCGCTRPRGRLPQTAPTPFGARCDGTGAPARLVDPFRSPPRSVSHRGQPSKVTAEYGSPPEIAGTPAPGSAFMSSFGLRPPFDRWSRCGQCASSD
jgi:hypothetical protein